MVKHNQTIRPHQPTNCLSVFDHFVGLVLKELTTANGERIQNHVDKERLNPLTTNVPHHIETSHLQCKSIDWFLYDEEH